jgi:hypothetical protein
MTKEIAKKEEQSLSAGGLENIIGIEPEDLNMPYVYVVRASAKHAVKADGSKASEGSFFHNTKKKEYKELEVLIAYAKKGTTLQTKPDGSTEEVKAWRTLMIPTDNLYSPFVMTFKGMNMWYGWKPFLSLLMAEGIKNPHVKVYKITSKDVTTQDGRAYPVPELTILRDSKKEELAAAKSILDRFGASIESVSDEDEPTESTEAEVEELVGDLDGKL